jgi:hypothetical protein
MSVKIEFKTSSTNIINKLKHNLDTAIEEAKEKIAMFLYDELVKTSPLDTGTFQKSWIRPEKVGSNYLIVNALPDEYIESGKYHRKTERITAPYNLYILEGEKAGAPESYATSEHNWVYRNVMDRSLQDTTILLWRFEQGALDLNPYMLLNMIFNKKIKGNI